MLMLLKLLKLFGLDVPAKIELGERGALRAREGRSYIQTLWPVCTVIAKPGRIFN